MSIVRHFFLVDQNDQISDCSNTFAFSIQSKMWTAFQLSLLRAVQPFDQLAFVSVSEWFYQSAKSHINGFFCSHLTHPHHYLAILAAPCPCSTICANLKKSVVMVHETASIWYFLRLCVVFKLLVLKSTVQHAIATVYHPLAGQEQLQAVEDDMQGKWVKLQVTQESYKNKKLILVRARPG